MKVLGTAGVVFDLSSQCSSRRGTSWATSSTVSSTTAARSVRCRVDRRDPVHRPGPDVGRPRSRLFRRCRLAGTDLGVTPIPGQPTVGLSNGASTRTPRTHRRRGDPSSTRALGGRRRAVGVVAGGADGTARRNARHASRRAPTRRDGFAVDRSSAGSTQPSRRSSWVWKDTAGSSTSAPSTKPTTGSCICASRPLVRRPDGCNDVRLAEVAQRIRVVVNERRRLFAAAA